MRLKRALAEMMIFSNVNLSIFQDTSQKAIIQNIKCCEQV